MKLRTSILPLAGVALVAAAVSNAPAKEMERSPKAEQKLAKALAGRTAGAPVNCIPNFQGKARMEVVDDWTILFREGDTVYVQNTQGRCNRISNGGYALVTRQYGSQQLCAGDINQLVEPTTGIQGGSCVYGQFVPYRKAG